MNCMIHNQEYVMTEEGWVCEQCEKAARKLKADRNEALMEQARASIKQRKRRWKRSW